MPATSRSSRRRWAQAAPELTIGVVVRAARRGRRAALAWIKENDVGRFLGYTVTFSGGGGLGRGRSAYPGRHRADLHGDMLVPRHGRSRRRSGPRSAIATTSPSCSAGAEQWRPVGRADPRQGPDAGRRVLGDARLKAIPPAWWSTTRVTTTASTRGSTVGRPSGSPAQRGTNPGPIAAAVPTIPFRDNFRKVTDKPSLRGGPRSDPRHGGRNRERQRDTFFHTELRGEWAMRVPGGRTVVEDTVESDTETISVKRVGTEYVRTYRLTGDRQGGTYEYTSDAGGRFRFVSPTRGHLDQRRQPDGVPAAPQPVCPNRGYSPCRASP